MIFFQETTLIRRTFLVAFVPKILQHVDVQWQENSSLLCPFPASLLTFPFSTQISSSFPTTKQIDPDLHSCFTLLTIFSCFMSLAAGTCDGNQHEPTCALGSSIIPQEPGELSQFPLVFLPSSRFCRVCNVANIPREMEEISRFP